MSLRIPYISLIYAVSENGVLGKGGSIPWHSPQDFEWFKKQTKYSIVVMGRKTWESLPVKPLPGRLNVVVTRQPDYEAPGAMVVHNLYDAIVRGRTERPDTQVFIIGGKELLEEGMRLAFDAWISKVAVEVELDDTCVKEPELPGTAEYHDVVPLFEGDDKNPRVFVRRILF